MRTGRNGLKDSIILSFIIVVVFFLVFHTETFSPQYNNLGGQHSWLSGSTIKFVNQWLEEGAVQLHFTTYENFDSIEFESMEDRTPYLSYPTGSTAAIYFVAKILGYHKINVSFLKHFQMVLFCAECIFIEIFTYLWLSHSLNHRRYIHMVLAFACSFIWMLMPINVYYLSNILFADQLIIFWIQLFLLIEYIGCIKNDNSSIMNMLKAVIIYCGMMTDYYFWIMGALAFVLSFIRNIEKRRGYKKIIRKMLYYVIPAILAVITYIWQLSYTDNWQKYLKNKFQTRTGGNVSDETGGSTILEENINNFFEGMVGSDNVWANILLIMLVILEMSIIIYYLLKQKRWKQIIIDERYSIMLLGFLAPVCQILLLRNHSAVHEFSKIKMTWVIVMLLLLFIVACLKLFSFDRYFEHVFCVLMFAAFCLILQIPFSAIKYMNNRVYTIDYSTEYAINQTLDYEDVCYSFTYSIPENPPQFLAVSGKRVYQINEIDEIQNLFPDLDEKARKILLIERRKDKTEEIAMAEAGLKQTGSIRYEDEDCLLIELNSRYNR